MNQDSLGIGIARFGITRSVIPIARTEQSKTPTHLSPDPASACAPIGANGSLRELGSSRGRLALEVQKAYEFTGLWGLEVQKQACVRRALGPRGARNAMSP